MELLGILYDTVGSPDAWQLWLEMLVTYADARSGFLILQDTETLDILFIAQVGYTKQPANHFGTGLRRREQPTPVDAPPERLRNEFYRRLGADHSPGVYLVMEGPCTVRLSLQRSPFCPVFDDNELEALQHLVPHLQRSLVLGRRVHQPQTTAQVAVNRISSPCILLNVAHRIVASNPLAKAMLARERWAHVNHDRLIISLPKISERVARLISDCFLALSSGHKPAGGFVAVRRDDMAPLVVAVMPFGEGVILIFYDPEQRYLPNDGVLKELFELTTTEARIAVHLASGKTVEDYARTHGVTDGAVKYHVKAIYKKTGARRHGDLVALLLSLAVQMEAELPDYVTLMTRSAGSANSHSIAQNIMQR